MNVIFKEQQPMRLDVFLAQKMNTPRNQAQKTIKAGRVFINEKPEKSNYTLKVGDKITVVAERSTARPNSIPTHDQQSAAPMPKIIAETNDYLVIEKPAGLIVHAKNEKQPAVVSWLVKKYPTIAKIADTESLIRDDETFRPGIIHRLDRDVSGLMLIAKTQDAFDFFKEQMRHKKIKKEYVALAHGKLDKIEGEINFEISRKAGEPKMAAHPFNSGKGKPSLTTYETLQAFKNFTLLKASPITGRTNQLRVHFFAIDHPIVGDSKYTNKREILQNKKINATRPFLHAAKMEFIDRQEHRQTFESKLPEELETILTKIK